MSLEEKHLEEIDAAMQELENLTIPSPDAVYFFNEEQLVGLIGQDAVDAFNNTCEDA